MIKAFISWNENQINNLKRDLLFFDELLFEQVGLAYYLAAQRGIAKDHSQIDGLIADIDYLKGKGVLNQQSLPNNFLEIAPELSNSFFENQELDGEIHHFLRTVMELSMKGVKAFNTQQQQQYLVNRKKMLQYSEQRSMLHSLIASKLDSTIKLTPIINRENLNFGHERINSLNLIITNIPIPNDKMPLNEILDFKNQNQLSYKRFHNWIGKLLRSDLKGNEIVEELEFMTLEFENRMKLEKTKYKLSQIEVVLSLPLEVMENIIKLNWGQIPKTILKARMNKINSLIAETKAPGREVAYLSDIRSKFENAT